MAFETNNIPADTHVLIAGPTASGKSGLALEIAETRAGLIVNADSLQVYNNWRVLTARPSSQDEARAPHALYGHVGFDQPYSVGAWLAEVNHLLQTGQRLIVVGGTGLYFRALTEGLAEIPPIPEDIRHAADTLRLNKLDEMRQALDAQTAQSIDMNNPMRVQRAWEVLTATGQGLRAWQKATPPPLLPVSNTVPLVLDAPKDWLNPRIEQRFDIMIEEGALNEAHTNLEEFDPDLPSQKAIGAPELISHLQGGLTLREARTASIIATQQYAKRQRTWFRARMKNWTWLPCPVKTG